jgi:hypothetical protein
MTQQSEASLASSDVRNDFPGAGERITALNPVRGKQGVRVDRATYEAYKAAVLAAVPESGKGLRFMDLSAAVEPLLPAAVRATTNCSWWTTCVKLDLEARGLLERVPGSRPQRLRRISPTSES